MDTRQKHAHAKPWTWHPSRTTRNASPRIVTYGFLDGSVATPFQQASASMYPVIPCEMVDGSWELVCYCFTVAVAVVSYLFTLR